MWPQTRTEAAIQERDRLDQKESRTGSRRRAGEICQISPQAQGPEKMCLSLEHQNPSYTSEKVGYFDRVTV